MTQDAALKRKIATVAIDYDRLKTVSGVVRLKDVLLVHSHWNSLARTPRMEVEPAGMAFKFALASATWDFLPELKQLEIELEYRLIAFARLDVTKDNESKDVQLFSLECEWSVVFSVPEDFLPTDLMALADFSVANGQLNAFPYVRQYVQDVTSRGGWPPLVLPTFRAPANRPVRFGGKRKVNTEAQD